MQSEPRTLTRPVWALSLSLAATQEIDVSFSSCGYLDVSVPRVPPVKLWIHLTVLRLYLSGFPHSDICGSVDICSSPQLFAAYHVLHRLPVPRHPPCALFCLTSFSMLSHQVAFGVASLTRGRVLVFGKLIATQLPKQLAGIACSLFLGPQMSANLKQA